MTHEMSSPWKIHLPWRIHYTKTRDNGPVPRILSHTFFPDLKDAKGLLRASPGALTRIIEENPDFTSRIIHQLISMGRLADARTAVQLLGRPEAANRLACLDWRTVLVEMAYDFVPKKEVQGVISTFCELGLTKILDMRVCLHQVEVERLAQVKKSAPQPDKLSTYFKRLNAGELDRLGPVPRTGEIRLIDPKRNFRFIGLGNTSDYDWVEVFGVDGYIITTHYEVPDLRTKIAILYRAPYICNLPGRTVVKLQKRLQEMQQPRHYIDISNLSRGFVD